MKFSVCNGCPCNQDESCQSVYGECENFIEAMAVSGNFIEEDLGELSE